MNLASTKLAYKYTAQYDVRLKFRATYLHPLSVLKWGLSVFGFKSSTPGWLLVTVTSLARQNTWCRHEKLHEMILGAFGSGVARSTKAEQQIKTDRASNWRACMTEVRVSQVPLDRTPYPFQNQRLITSYCSPFIRRAITYLARCPASCCGVAQRSRTFKDEPCCRQGLAVFVAAPAKSGPHFNRRTANEQGEKSGDSEQLTRLRVLRRLVATVTGDTRMRPTRRQHSFPLDVYLQSNEWGFKRFLKYFDRDNFFVWKNYCKLIK